MYRKKYIVILIFSRKQPALPVRPPLGSSLTLRKVERVSKLVNFAHIFTPQILQDEYDDDHKDKI